MFNANVGYLCQFNLSNLLSLTQFFFQNCLFGTDFTILQVKSFSLGSLHYFTVSMVFGVEHILLYVSYKMCLVLTGFNILWIARVFG
jgi:hypothetical protein